MYKSRTVEGLKVQVGNDILARGEKEFEKNLKKLPWFLHYILLIKLLDIF